MSSVYANGRTILHKGDGLSQTSGPPAAGAIVLVAAVAGFATAQGGALAITAACVGAGLRGVGRRRRRRMPRRAVRSGGAVVKAPREGTGRRPVRPVATRCRLIRLEPLLFPEYSDSACQCSPV